MRNYRTWGWLLLPALAGCPECTAVLGNLTPKAVLNPSVVNFGVVRVGATCVGEMFIENNGQGELTVASAEVRDDASGGAFSVVSFPTENVLSGGAEKIVLQFAPTQVSSSLQLATVAVGTNDPDRSEVRGTVTGEATTQSAGKLLPECKVHVADETAGLCLLAEFGSTPKLEPGAAGGLTRQVLVRNDGTAPFELLGVQVLPANGATVQPEFTVDLVANQPPAYPITVQPSREGDCGEPLATVPQGIPVSIKFSPTTVGIQTARLQIITNAPTAGTGEGNPSLGQANINLSGVGSGVGLGVEPEFISFGTVMVGATETHDVRVANLDINPAAVNTACIDINDNGTCYADPMCTSGCAEDPEDVVCTGGDADATLGLDCDVEGFGKGFPMEGTDAMPGGADEALIHVSWTPPAAASFSKDLLLMSNIQGNRVYSVRLTGGVAGNLLVNPSQVTIAASTDDPTATGAGSFEASNNGMAPLVITRIAFEGSASITDDFVLTRDGDPSFMMGCTRAPNEMSCAVPPWTTPLTLEVNETVTFHLAFADNDAVVSLQTFSVAISHNGTGGSPFSVDVDVCKPAGGTSSRPTCP